MPKRIEQLLRLAADMQNFEKMGNMNSLETDELSEDLLMLVAAAGDPMHGEEMFKKGFQKETDPQN